MTAPTCAVARGGLVGHAATGHLCLSLIFSYYVKGCMKGCMRDERLRCFSLTAGRERLWTTDSRGCSRTSTFLKTGWGRAGDNKFVADDRDARASCCAVKPEYCVLCENDTMSDASYLHTHTADFSLTNVFFTMYSTLYVTASRDRSAAASPPSAGPLVASRTGERGHVVATHAWSVSRLSQLA